MLKLEVGKMYVDDEGVKYKITELYEGRFRGDSASGLQSKRWYFDDDGRAVGEITGEVFCTLIREHTEESPLTGFTVGRFYRDAAGNVGECNYVTSFGERGHVAFKTRTDVFNSDGTAWKPEKFGERPPIVAEVPAPQAQPAPPPIKPATPEQDERVPFAALPDPNAAMLARDKPDTRSCTCHPDDNPPQPCARKFAYWDCVAAAPTPKTPAHKLSGVHIASPDLTPMGHQVAPHWAIASRE